LGAIDHVTKNLAEPLELEEVAKVACFSPYHFHRIFRAVVGRRYPDLIVTRAPKTRAK